MSCIYIYINVCFLFLYISTTDKETTWTGWRVNSFYLDPCMLSPSMSFGGKKTCWSLAFDVEVGWWSWRSQACLVDLMWRIALPDMLLSFRISDMALGIPLKTRLQGSIWPPHLFFLLVQFVVKTVATGALGVMVSWQVSLCSQKVVTLSIDGGGWHCSDMGCPPLSTSSHHQDLDIFDRGFHKASFKSLKLGRGKKPSYDYVVEKNTKKTVWD